MLPLAGRGGTFTQADDTIAANAKIFVEPMDGFDGYVIEAIKKQKVPVLIVADRLKAVYSISGAFTAGQDTRAWSGAKPNGANLKLTNLETDVVIWAYTAGGPRGSGTAGNMRKTADEWVKQFKRQVRTK